MDEIIKAVVAHAAEVAPNECCGLVVVRKGREVYVPCRNAAPDPANRFMIDPEEYADAEDQGEIAMIAHSHVYVSPAPSEADRTGCENSGLPWLIVNYPNGHHTVTEPCGYRAPLIGRVFTKGVHDCYALVRDYYAERLQIELPDMVRPEVWFEEGRSILLENFEAFGFKVISPEEIQPNDCLFMQIGSTVPNHCAVYVGDGCILHHVIGRLSSRDVYGGLLQQTTTHCLRYVG